MLNTLPVTQGRRFVLELAWLSWNLDSSPPCLFLVSDTMSPTHLVKLRTTHPSRTGMISYLHAHRTTLAIFFMNALAFLFRFGRYRWLKAVIYLLTSLHLFCAGFRSLVLFPLFWSPFVHLESGPSAAPDPYFLL